VAVGLSGADVVRVHVGFGLVIEVGLGATKVLVDVGEKFWV
jgi:hypothetical protein